MRRESFALAWLLVAFGCGSDPASGPALDASPDGTASLGSPLDGTVLDGPADATRNSALEGSPLDGPPPDAPVLDGPADGTMNHVDSAACPAQVPSGRCSQVGLACSYGCEGCSCEATGQWYCTTPGCAGGCIASPGGAPPEEGSSCGGCCGPGIGTTCVYACEDGGGEVSATCGGSGTWHLNAPCGALRDAAADTGGDAACSPLFKSCMQSSECCAPYRCINITGTLQCQDEGPAIGGD